MILKEDRLDLDLPLGLLLDNLIYKGTQYDGSNAAQFNPSDDPQRAVPAYQLLVGGSDTLTTLQVVQG